MKHYHSPANRLRSITSGSLPRQDPLPRRLIVTFCRPTSQHASTSTQQRSTRHSSHGHRMQERACAPSVAASVCRNPLDECRALETGGFLRLNWAQTMRQPVSSACHPLRSREAIRDVCVCVTVEASSSLWLVTWGTLFPPRLTPVW